MAIFKLVPTAFFFISRIRERLPRRCALFAKRAGLLAMTLLFLLMLLLIVNSYFPLEFGIWCLVLIPFGIWCLEFGALYLVFGSSPVFVL